MRSTKNYVIKFIFIFFFFFYACDEESEPTQEVVEQVPVEMSSIIPSTTAGRTNIKQGCIETNSRFATISLWDHKKIDGDIISFYVNGKKVVSEHTLDGPNNKKTFDITLSNNGYNYVTLLAHNLGNISPNTAAVSINGEEFTLRSNLKTNGAFDIVVTGYGATCSDGSSGTSGNTGSSGNSGSTNTGNTGSNTNSKGKISFYTRSDLGCGPIKITVDGNITKTLNQYFPSGINDCSQGTSFELTPGTHSYTASCQNQTWNSSFQITADGCLKYELKSNSGNTNTGNSGNTGSTGNNTNSKGKIAFYTKSDLGCGSIKITVDGKITKTLNQYFPSGISGCNQGTVFELEPGTHSYRASCSKYNWSANFQVTQNGCLRYELK